LYRKSGTDSFTCTVSDGKLKATAEIDFVPFRGASIIIYSGLNGESKVGKLSLATLGFVSLPSRLIESAIAVSVILAALNNVYPFRRARVQCQAVRLVNVVKAATPAIR
jgi:hypothetical protein